MMVNTICLNRLDNLINEYQLQCRIDNKSPKTILTYTAALESLQKYLKKNGLSTDASRIGIQELKGYILNLQHVVAFEGHPFTKPQERGLSGHTINCYLRAIRAFWSWLIAEEIVDRNPFDRIRIQKPPKKIIPAFTEEQLRSLISVIDRSKPVGFRDYIIILLLLDTGLRVSELARLKLVDLNLNNRTIKVNGKGAKERMVPIGTTVQRSLLRYLRKHRALLDSLCLDFLFLTKNGEAVTANCIENMMDRRGIEANIDGVRCSPHTLRHTFALNYLRNGGDLFTLQRILGHETLEMVRNYVNVAMYDIQNAHLKYSPVDKMYTKNP
jgi:integrase/recombinase XerD